jgi:hypothetical protein
MNLLTSSSTLDAHHVHVVAGSPDGETLENGMRLADGSRKHSYHGWHVGIGLPLSVDHLNADTGDRSTITSWNVLAAVRQLRVESHPPCC